MSMELCTLPTWIEPAARHRSLLRLLAALGTFWLIFATPAFPSLSPLGSRQSARRAYDRAIRMRIALESRPEASRRLDDYQETVDAFLSVYRTDASFHLAPSALAAAATLNEEMGRRFANDQYYLKSIQIFKTLIAHYPRERISADALFTIGAIYGTDLQDPEDARSIFSEFLGKYPRSDHAANARAKIHTLDQLMARREQKAAPSPAEPPQQPGLGSVPEITDIRDWVGPNYTRVVVSVERPVAFDTARLKNPDRIFLDLENSRLSPTLVGKTFPVENGFLRQVRVGQFKPSVARVVLDVEKVRDYSVFSIPDPFRLVIDIHGPPVKLPTVAQTSSAAQPGGAEARSKTAASTEAPAQERARSSEAESAPSESHAGVPGTVAREAAPAQPPAYRTNESGKLTSSAYASEPLEITPANPIPNGSPTLTRALGLKIARIVIDPGHGGYDTGTIGPGGIEEKNVVLDVALRLRKLLEKRSGSDVIMTRATDTFIPLEERTAIGNEKAADLFISIHANASHDRSARGLETYYLNFTSDPEALALAARENASSQESVHELQDMIKKIALNEKIEESREFAEDVQQRMERDLAKDGDRLPNRGIKKAPFVVLIGANMPSILVEISFLSNPHDARLLKGPRFRQEIAQALYDGVTRYMNELGGIKVAQRSRTATSSAADAADPH